MGTGSIGLLAIAIFGMQLEDDRCSKWNAAHESAIDLAQHGQLMAAEKLLRATAGLASCFGPTSREVALTLNSRGAVYQRLAMTDSAERCYLQALDIWLKLPDGDVRGRQAISNNLAGLYLERGQLDPAERILRRELTAPHGPDNASNMELARSREKMATLLFHRKKYVEAEAHILEAIRMCERSAGPNHPETAIAWSDLATLESATGRHADAIAHLSKALAMLEEATGPNHVGMVSPLSNLALAYARARQPAQAELMVKRALGIAEATYGPEDIRIAAVLSVQSEVLRKMGRKREAGEIQKRSARIRYECSRAGRSAGVIDITDLRK